jgi:hypothetical protein
MGTGFAYRRSHLAYRPKWTDPSGRASRVVLGLKTICDKRYAIGVLMLVTAACRQDMHDQPKYKPLKASRFFADGRASRPRVPGTVARGHLNDDVQLYTGKVDNVFATTFPAPVTMAVLERGQERYNIYCTPCHDRTGRGNGMIVQRGYRRPPSFHIDRLRAAPVGYFFDVISNGFGVMPNYSAQIPVGDRWAIIAYVRALQLSEHATLAEVPPAEQQRLPQRAPAAGAPTTR